MALPKAVYLKLMVPQVTFSHSANALSICKELFAGKLPVLAGSRALLRTRCFALYLR